MQIWMTIWHLAEAMLKYVIRYVMEERPEEMEFFNSFVDKGLLDRLKPCSKI